MRDDEMMDALLRTALAAPPPRLLDGFERAVMRRTAPRRLSMTGWATLLVYGIASIVACVWFMRGLPVPIIAGGLLFGVAIALSATAYVSSLVRATNAVP